MDAGSESGMTIDNSGQFLNIVRDHRNGSIAPCLADIDLDGDKDLVLTNNNIGLQLFLNPQIQTDIWDINPGPTNTPERFLMIECYPNPFNSAVTISVENAPAKDMVVEIYDILGRLQESLSTKNGYAIWDASDYSSGVYFARVRAPQNTAIRKLLYLK
jgi:hypothetical protein